MSINSKSLTIFFKKRKKYICTKRGIRISESKDSMTKNKEQTATQVDSNYI